MKIFSSARLSQRGLYIAAANTASDLLVFYRSTDLCRGLKLSITTSRLSVLSVLPLPQCRLGRPKIIHFRPIIVPGKKWPQSLLSNLPLLGAGFVDLRTAYDIYKVSIAAPHSDLPCTGDRQFALLTTRLAYTLSGIQTPISFIVYLLPSGGCLNPAIRHFTAAYRWS